MKALKALLSVILLCMALVALSPSGNALYVANHSSNTINQFQVSSSTGQLTSFSTSTISTSSGPIWMSVTK